MACGLEVEVDEDDGKETLVLYLGTLDSPPTTERQGVCEIPPTFHERPSTWLVGGSLACVHGLIRRLWWGHQGTRSRTGRTDWRWHNWLSGSTATSACPMTHVGQKSVARSPTCLCMALVSAPPGRDPDLCPSTLLRFAH